MAGTTEAPNLILTGFMGTGKTSIGRRIAAAWDRPFLDFDAELARRFGRPIPQIFAEEGEPAFRAAEAALCGALPVDAGLVVATGGGTVVDPVSRASLEARGVLICLRARGDVLLARLQAAGPATRPMLGADPPAALARLLAAREPAYAAVALQVDTSDASPEAVVAAIEALYEAAVHAPVRPREETAHD